MERIKKGLIIFESVMLLMISVHALAMVPQEVYTAAETGLPFFLSHIPSGEEKGYGFNNREEFGRAELGVPYEMHTIYPDRLSKGETAGPGLIVSAREWRFRVKCDGQARALLTVAEREGKWQAVDIGAAGLAAEIDKLEKALSLTEDTRRVILRLYQIKADLVVISEESGRIEEGRFYPLPSFRSSLQATSMAMGSEDTLFSFERLLPILQERFRHESF